MKNLDDILEDKDIQRTTDRARLYRNEVYEFVASVLSFLTHRKVISTRVLQGKKEPMYRYHVILTYRRKTGRGKLTCLINGETMTAFEAKNLDELKQAVLDLEIEGAVGDVIRPVKMEFTGSTAAKLEESGVV